jgi:hypothetical protein
LPDEERKRLLDEFWDEVTEGLDLEPEFYQRMRSAKPKLPDDPSPEQLTAWIELAELVQDGAQHEPWCAWMATAEQAISAGHLPDSEQGRALADEVARTWAVEDDPATPEHRIQLADRIDATNDARAERYWQLLATINGWPPVPTRHPVVQWLSAALRVSGTDTVTVE